MKPEEKKLSSFIDGLKSSNISSNITSLNVYSEQIELLQNQLINKQYDSPIISENLQKSLDVIIKTKDNQLDPKDLINYYIKYGDILKSTLTYIKVPDDKKCFKDIAINYLNIAKQTKDTRIKNIAISIADELSE